MILFLDNYNTICIIIKVANMGGKKADMVIDLEKERNKKEKAVIVTVDKAGGERWAAGDKEEELSRLTRSCGVDIAESFVCKCRRITSDLLIGSGKAEEIADAAGGTEADVVIFGEDLSPSQQKNLETMMATRVIDRTQLILDVFAHRATSREGRVQVELAQLVYLLPRLSRMWLHLSRQRGGVGTRGPGEQQLEMDRRRLRERIGRLKRELREITRQRELRRAQRGRFSLLNIALVGYTNSGKSTLFNALTSSRVKTRDQLFSTLDPTVRKMTLPNNQTVLVSDTVGFLHDLPHHLIESFKATLEEVTSADILFHVVDMSAARIAQQKAAVREVLEDLGAGDKPVVTVLNKADKVLDPAERRRIAHGFENPLEISALTGEGLMSVEDRIVQLVQKDMEDIELVLPHGKLGLAGIIRDKGVVKEEEYRDKGLYIKARLPRKDKHSIFKKLKRP